WQDLRDSTTPSRRACRSSADAPSHLAGLPHHEAVSTNRAPVGTSQHTRDKWKGPTSCAIDTLCLRCARRAQVLLSRQPPIPPADLSYTTAQRKAPCKASSPASF